jgi:hypothetical protein
MARAKEPRDWWQVHPDDWSPIASFADHDGGPVVFANDDKSKTWLAMDGKLANAEPHELAEDGERMAPGEAPAFWAAA